MKILYFDCFCGAAGDMLLGALIDAGADFAEIERRLASLGVGGYHLHCAPVNKRGIMAMNFDVHTGDHPHPHDHGRAHDHGHEHAPAHSHGHAHSHTHTHTHEHSHDHGHTHTHAHGHTHEHPHEHGHSHAQDHGHDHHDPAHGHAHEHTHEHTHGHDHVHRHLKDIVKIINAGDLPDAVKSAAIATFERIAVAEAKVHGTTPDKIHFHEVGAVDSIVDIVGVHLALDQLKPDRIESSPVHLGKGTVKCAHGVMPVPAPATALLLEGVPSYAADVDGELTTPTGAALIAQLAQAFGPMPPMRVLATGNGAGNKDLPDRPNIVRVFLGEAIEARPTATINVIEANIDDMSPELLAPVIGTLLDAGARDAFFTPVFGKKGRPGHLLTVLAKDEERDALARLILEQTTTFGLRMRREERIELEREWREVDTPWGRVRIKLGGSNGAATVQSPEFEDCRRVAETAHIPVRRVYEAALAAAVKGEWIHG
jgi:pyridinium-3,5-bisthiocarboxylic acid mononucleotide nickel chelatase